MRYLTVSEVLAIHTRVMEQSGGSVGIRDIGALEAADPRQTQELLPSPVARATMLPHGPVAKWQPQET